MSLYLRQANLLLILEWTGNWWNSETEEQRLAVVEAWVTLNEHQYWFFIHLVVCWTQSFVTSFVYLWLFYVVIMNQVWRECYNIPVFFDDCSGECSFLRLMIVLFARLIAISPDWMCVEVTWWWVIRSTRLCSSRRFSESSPKTRRMSFAWHSAATLKLKLVITMHKILFRNIGSHSST